MPRPRGPQERRRARELANAAPSRASLLPGRASALPPPRGQEQARPRRPVLRAAVGQARIATTTAELCTLSLASVAADSASSQCAGKFRLAVRRRAVGSPAADVNEPLLLDAFVVCLTPSLPGHMHEYGSYGTIHTKNSTVCRGVLRC